MPRGVTPSVNWQGGQHLKKINSTPKNTCYTCYDPLMQSKVKINLVDKYKDNLSPFNRREEEERRQREEEEERKRIEEEERMAEEARKAEEERLAAAIAAEEKRKAEEEAKQEEERKAVSSYRRATS